MAKTLWDYLTDAGEVMASLGTGAVASVAGPAYGIYKGFTSPKYGTYEGGREADKAAMDMMARLTYQPRGEFAQGLLGKVGGAMDTMKIPAVLPEVAPLAALSLNDKAILSQAQRGAQAAKPVVGNALEGYMARSGLAPRAIPESPAMPQPKPTAPVSPAGFYSATEQAALNLQRNKGSGQAFINDLIKAPDVKKDELEAIGLLDAFAKKPQTTKQELIDFIGENKIDLNQSRLGGAEPFDKNRLAQLESEYRSLKQHPIDDPSFGEEKYNELIKLLNIRDQSTTQSLYDAAEQATRSAQRAQRQGNKKTAEKYFREAEFLNTRAEKLDLQGQGMSNPPRYDQYKLQGGTNYQETLLTLPMAQRKYVYDAFDPRTQKSKQFATRAEAENFANQDETGNTVVSEIKVGKENYRSSHWDQPNVMAHIRTQDFVDADGKNMRLIEEVQSDWHQAGREKGYADKKSLEGWYNENKIEGDPPFSELNAEQISIIERNRSVGMGGFQGVPDAPMKETWYQTALRKAVKDAIDAGQDRVGITTGARQAERYDLSKQISEVNYSGTDFVAYDKNGASVIRRTGVSESDLPDLIGKEAAKKLLEQPKQGTLRSLSGVDLQVGGEGMKKYYDDVYPKYLEKFAKKYGAKVKEGSVPTERSRDANGIPSMYPKQEPVKYIDITPEMRKAFGGNKGVPLFQAAPLIPVGTGGLLDQFGQEQ